MSKTRTQLLLFSIFVVSGFTGLIYESIWSHYLKLFLGHAAYAQALVLTIFMGGMAIGAWFTGKHLTRWSNLLMIYAAIEGIIGLLGLGFHNTFEYVLALSFDQIIPSLNNPTAVHLYKWTTGALLILPQSILLGMTFPLMSNGLIRIVPDSKGATLSMLYFCNSIGAAIGVLVSGFYLIEKVGLPGTILTAGLINVGLAIFVYKVAKINPVKKQIEATDSKTSYSVFFLVAAFITGAASFIYEIAWIRMLSMVMGASTHSFELMLSAFITGLAFGGLWIYKRIDRYDSPVRVAGYVQIIMGICALATIPLYNYTFDLMAVFMQALDQTESGYRFFTFSSHFIALLVMLPATFCAGMTLPLFTFILLKKGYGEKSIGYVYASNTLGAIVGIAFTIYIGLPVLGIKNSILLGSVLDIVLGICLIVFLIPKLDFKSHTIPALVVCTLVVYILVWTDFDKRRMASGVFRESQKPISGNENILFHKDGRTASVSVVESETYVSILTNGKPDAALDLRANPQPTGDELTMVFAGLIPLSIQPETRTVANIGLGSGLTTHTVLSSPNVTRVDTIEIEAAIVEGANNFRPRVERAYSDERSHIYIEDAKTFFSTHNKKYDVIISEPSNPWVSGVSSLFTEEFYERMTHHLEDDGLLVQWLHLYELNMPLVFSVLKALTTHFPNFAIYSASGADVIIVAKKNSPVNQPEQTIFNNSEIEKEFASLNLKSVHDIRSRFIGNNETLQPLINEFIVPANSDYFPYLDLNATRARYLKQEASRLIDIKHSQLPVNRVLLPEYNIINTEKLSKNDSYTYTTRTINAGKLIHYINNKADSSIDLSTAAIPTLSYLMTLANSCEAHLYPELWIDSFYSLTTISIPYLQTEDLEIILKSITPECKNGLSDQQIKWLALYKSFIDSNVNNITKNSAYLLNNANNLSMPKKRFLFSAYILGLVASGSPDLKAAWEKHIEELSKNAPTPLWLMMLYTLGISKTI